MSTATVLLRALAAAGLAIACNVDDILVGAPCESADDCPNLNCVRTPSEEASGNAGRCSETTTCVPGEQEGCAASSDGSCSSFELFPTEDEDGRTFCCPDGNGTRTVVGVSEDGSTAECFLCPSCSSSEESCSAGDDRCVAEGDAPCGCRPTDAAIENEPCEDDATCGGGFTCVRTLEQMAEPDEPEVAEQGIEAGQCRPESDAACVGGQQVGCLLPSGGSCQGSTNRVDVGSLSYCCPDATSTDFLQLVYATTDDQSSAACTACSRRACPNAAGDLTEPQCTAITDPACIVDDGFCGCPPLPG